MIESFTHRIIIFSGCFGSGKTNIAVNAALQYAAAGKKVRLADLDIVNPYFRSADNKKLLEDAGVQCIIPEYAGSNVDIPSLAPEYQSIFFTDDICIADVGGDPEGSIVLAGDAQRYEKCGYDMVFTVNFRRPSTLCAEDALTLMRSIEQVSHLKFTHIVHNTNLGAESTPELIRSYIPEAEKLSELSRLQIAAHTSVAAGEGLTQILGVTKQLF